MKISDHVLESDIQAELYHRLRLCDIIPRMELKVPSKLHRSGKMRVDIAIVVDKHLRAVVECKNPGTKAGKAWYARQSFSKDRVNRQQRAYSMFEIEHNVPVLWCRSMKDISPTVIRILEILEM